MSRTASDGKKDQIDIDTQLRKKKLVAVAHFDWTVS